MTIPGDRDADALLAESEQVRLKASPQPQPAAPVSRQSPATGSPQAATESGPAAQRWPLPPVKLWPILGLTIAAAVCLLWHGGSGNGGREMPVGPSANFDSAMRFMNELVKHNGIDSTFASSRIAGPLSRLDRDALASGFFASVSDGIDNLNGRRKPPATRDEVNLLFARLSKGPAEMKHSFKTAEAALKEMGPAIIPDLESYASQIIPDSADSTDAILSAWKKEICVRVLASFGDKGTDSLIRVLQLYMSQSRHYPNMSRPNQDVYNETVYSLLDNHYAFAHLSDLALSNNKEERTKALQLMDLLIDRCDVRNVMLKPTLEPVLSSELASAIVGNHETIKEMGCVEGLSESSVKLLVHVINDRASLPAGVDRQAESALALILKRTDGSAHQLPDATRSQVIEAIKTCQSRYSLSTKGFDNNIEQATVAKLVDRALVPAGYFSPYVRPKMLTTVAFNDGYTVRELLGPIRPAGQ